MSEPRNAPVLDETEQEAQLGRLTHLFFFLCFAMVAAFVLWASFGRLEVVSSAMGEVIPSTQVKSVQHLEGGIIQEIKVREGDRVQQGQVLLSLEPVQTGANVEELQVRLTALTAEINRLEAEAEGREEIVFDPAFASTNAKLVQDTVNFFETRKKRFANQLAGQGAEIEQHRQQAAEIKTRIGNNQRTLSLLREQIGISNDLLKDKLTNRMTHLNLLKEEAAIEGRITEDRAALKRVDASAKQSTKKLEAIRHSFVEVAQEDLEEKRREVDELANRLRKFEDSLSRTELRSPVEGVVKTLHIVTIGGVVKPGDTVVDLVPAGDRLIIEARLPTQDVGWVQPGQKALITLASADAQRFGDLEGEVLTISPDAVEDQDGVPFYRVRIATPQDHFERDGVRYSLVPGVQVASSILTGERSVMAYLMDPFLSATRRALRER